MTLTYIGREIIVDNFAGGGGASTGIELATGRSVDIAINHDTGSLQLSVTSRSIPVVTAFCSHTVTVERVIKRFIF